MKKKGVSTRRVPGEDETMTLWLLVLVSEAFEVTTVGEGKASTRLASMDYGGKGGFEGLPKVVGL